MGGDISVLVQEWGGYVSKSSLTDEYFTDVGVERASDKPRAMNCENIY